MWTHTIMISESLFTKGTRQIMIGKSITTVGAREKTDDRKRRYANDSDIIAGTLHKVYFFVSILEVVAVAGRWI